MKKDDINNPFFILLMILTIPVFVFEFVFKSIFSKDGAMFALIAVGINVVVLSFLAAAALIFALPVWLISLIFN
jgi:hypothetical protein